MSDSPQSRSVVCPGCGRVVAVDAPRCPGCGRRRPGLWGLAPALGRFGDRLRFTPIVLWGCALLYLTTLLWEPEAIWRLGEDIGRGRIFSLLAPASKPLFLFGMSGRIPIFELGRWWTVLSAGWLHGSVLHIALNLLWIRHLAPTVSRHFGAARLVILYTVSSAAGFLLTSTAALLPLPGPLSGASFTVGASAPLFGLFGALVLYGQRTGDRRMSRDFLQFVAIWVVIGVIASSGGPTAIRIDNWAHLGGFAGGYLSARWLDPTRREDPRHVLAALLCLAAMALSIVASVVHGLRFVG